jgi:hypothetical protein
MQNISKTVAAIALAVSSFAVTPVFAAPNCVGSSWGSKCDRCYGWASYPVWAAQACKIKTPGTTMLTNPNPAFACPTSAAAIQCKVIKKIDLTVDPKNPM